MSTTHQTATAQTRRRRARPSRLVLVVLVAILVVMVLGVGYLLGYRLNITTGHVAVPTVKASPEQVVSAYVEAYNHRDWTTMATIYPTQLLDRHRALGTMTDLSVVSSQALPGPEDGNPAEPGVSYYKVRVTLQLHDLTGSDLAYEPGPNGWAYLLERRGPAAPWHIAEHGNP